MRTVGAKFFSQDMRDRFDRRERVLDFVGERSCQLSQDGELFLLQHAMLGRDLQGLQLRIVQSDSELFDQQQ